MSCVKDETLLEQYLDGELAAALVSQVEAALESCAHCRAYVEELSQINLALKEDVAAAVAAAPLDQLWGRISAEIEKAPLAAVPAAPADEPAAGLAQRLRSWWQEQRLELALGGMAAAAAVVICVWFVQSMPTTGPVADPAPQAQAPDNSLVVESAEAAHGTIIIDVDPEDPSAPAVVWHLVDDEEGRI